LLLSLFPYGLAKFLWLLLSVAALFSIFTAVHRLCVRHTASFWVSVGLQSVAFLVCIKYFIVSIRYLNVHTILLACMLGAFVLVYKKRDWSAAVLFSVAICVKVVPVLLLPYFMIKRKWKFVYLTAALTIVLTFLPSFYFGFRQNAAILEDWYQTVVVNTAAYDVNGPLNLSLQGQLTRYLSDFDYSRRTADSAYVPVNVASLSSAEIRELYILFATLIYFGVLAT